MKLISTICMYVFASLGLYHLLIGSHAPFLSISIFLFSFALIAGGLKLYIWWKSKDSHPS